MGYVVGPNSSYHGGRNTGRFGGVLRDFVVSFARIVRNYGMKGLAALVFAALFAFSPLTLLYWFNELRLVGVVSFANGQPVVVKTGRYESDQEQDEPGETALLKVVCDTEIDGGLFPLLLDDDPRRKREGLHETAHIRREMVYLRPAGLDPPAPFALLGLPPVSVWVPAGEYEVLVVHEAPPSQSYLDKRPTGFPLISVIRDCSLENGRTTVCRVVLSHYDWGFSPPIEIVAADGTSEDRRPTADELAPLLAACERVDSIPTPGGCLMALDEPIVHHDEEHRRCIVDYSNLRAVPREWTRQQVATVWNWLPPEAIAARARIWAEVDALQWREVFQGWSCYLAAGVAGLVFTRWGALAMLEPWRRGDSFRESLGLLVKLFLLSVLAMIVYQIVTATSIR